MTTLTVRQPWAHAILHLGKRVENRTRRTRRRGPLLIHAGASGREFGELAAGWQARFGVGLPDPAGVPFAAVVGVVDVVGCRRAGQRGLCDDGPPDPWESGPWCWLLANPPPLPEPLPYSGLLGLFNVPDDVIPPAFRG